MTKQPFNRDAPGNKFCVSSSAAAGASFRDGCSSGFAAGSADSAELRRPTMARGTADLASLPSLAADSESRPESEMSSFGPPFSSATKPSRLMLLVLDALAEAAAVAEPDFALEAGAAAFADTAARAEAKRAAAGGAVVSGSMSVISKARLRTSILLPNVLCALQHTRMNAKKSLKTNLTSDL